MSDDRDKTDNQLTRRGYLGVLGATTAVALGSTQVASATDEGYGGSGYGSGPYGGQDSTTTSVGVSTHDATGVGTSSATLVGELTELQNADSATVYFEWGTKGSGLANTTSEEIVSSTGTFDASVSGLDSDTDYEFRAVARADGKTATGATSTFRTDTGQTTEGVPTIDELTGADVSNPKNPHVDAELQWAASIDESELYAAVLTLSNPDGQIETWEYDLSSQSASATETTRIPQAHEEATEYTVDLTVYSYYGNTDQQTTTFEPQ